MTESSAPSPVLYEEHGVSRLWLVIAPVLAIVMLVTEYVNGVTVHWPLWLGLAVLADLFIAMQVYAGRTHISVRLDRDSLRCGNETVAVGAIDEILPGYAPDDVKRRKGAPAPDAPAWTRARTLGQLPRVPRRRYPIGLRLQGGETVQAWAKNDYALREALAPLVSA
ncbi:DUF3093 family protein [Tsukamurella sp. 8F]|uniref:DUF3093 family protein n=1 Tax=unclassified Tsukamurella TaxID=2633480 RepID=UPI0023B9863E|nr:MULTISPECIES: DUF3093 family protein [unclassified Tsukamurella]MDF0531721.1 DUF3093 family protein [Tsukamurella sp. 8J]MDF0588967.1 DUF3093 family protein [Tsukamurella sp. 8F]